MSLAELPRPLTEAVLACSFDSRELHNRLNDLGLAPEAEDLTLDTALRLIPRCPRLVGHLDAVLDRMHLGCLGVVWDSDAVALLKWCRFGDYRRCSCLAGMLWALARDPRAEVVQGARLLVERLLADAVDSAGEDVGEDVGEVQPRCYDPAP